MKIGRKAVEKVDEQEARVDNVLERLRASESSARIIIGALLVILVVAVVLWLM